MTKTELVRSLISWGAGKSLETSRLEEGSDAYLALEDLMVWAAEQAQTLEDTSALAEFLDEVLDALVLLDNVEHDTTALFLPTTALQRYTEEVESGSSS